jgi:hypothetical protein
MTTLKAHFDGKVLVPEEPVDLPVDCTLQVHVETTQPSRKSKKRPLSDLVELAKKFPAHGPADGAAQHDHYLYGTPKKPNP